MLRRIGAALLQGRIWFLLATALCLTGCAQYEVGIQFYHANAGAIVQHIQLAESLTRLSDTSVQQWFTHLEQQARQNEGHIQRLSDRELAVTIPFHNGQELEARFNQFFQTSTAIAPALTALPEIQSHLSLQQNNFLLVLRNRLILDVDLRALGVREKSGSVVVSPGALLNLQFRLKTPWGAKVINTGEPQVPMPRIEQQSSLIWPILPGQQNHLAVIFWLPSPVGLGALGIGLLVLLGALLRARLLPAPPTRFQAPAATNPSPPVSPR